MTLIRTGSRAAGAGPLRDARAPRRNVVAGVLAVALAAITGYAPAQDVAGGAAHPQRLLVLSSSDAPPYQQALAGIRRRAVGFALDEKLLTAFNQDSMLLALRRAGSDTAVVTLGTRAGELAARAAPAAPVVNCMVLSPEAAANLPNAQVVPIEIPADAQIEWLGKLLPRARSIGLLFDPAINARRVETLATALVRAGYSPLLAPVTSHAMLPQALSRLPKAADAVLAIADSTVYTQQAAKALLLFSFRNKIPLIGLTEAWVKAGALYALDWDYHELGGYCAALAMQSLARPRASSPAPARPHVAINLRTAQQFRLAWSPELVGSVDRTYE